MNSRADVSDRWRADDESSSISGDEPLGSRASAEQLGGESKSDSPSRLGPNVRVAEILKSERNHGDDQTAAKR